VSSGIVASVTKEIGGPEGVFTKRLACNAGDDSGS
jgi:hypothetical protein